MGRLIQADRRATLTEITTRYNQGMQESICEIHNLEADGLQQQKTPPGTTHLHYKKEKEATICKSSPKLDS